MFEDVNNTSHLQTLISLCLTKYRLLFCFVYSAVEPHITAVPPSDPVCPADSLILQCSVSESQNNTRPEENSVCFIITESYQSYPSFNSIQENTLGEYEKNSSGLSANKCVFSFFKNTSCSAAGTYCCSVETRGDTESENRSKLNNEGNYRTN